MSVLRVYIINTLRDNFTLKFDTILKIQYYFFKTFYIIAETSIELLKYFQDKVIPSIF